MIQDPELQQKVIDTLLTTDPTVCETAAIAIDHLEPVSSNPSNPPPPQ
jgi:hypothetical protein